MTDDVVTVDYTRETADGPLVRFSGTPKAVAELRAVFQRLASGETAVPGDDLRLHGVDALEFRQGDPGGLRLAHAEPVRVVFGGSRDQWETRARLLDPLTEHDPGFQYLDYGDAGEIGVVVSTYPDGSF